jgi:hypothetical protein
MADGMGDPNPDEITAPAEKPPKVQEPSPRGKAEEIGDFQAAKGNG